VSSTNVEVRLDLPCEPESVGTARNGVAAMAERLGAAVDDVKIAVSEAVGNAIVHAYRDGKSGGIRVFGREERGRLVVTVADDGIGMAPHPTSPGLRIGIPLITKLCDDVRFSSSEEGTTVSMSFAAPAPSEAGSEPALRD
jgi:anti-sigma regulatory factor (Ser/Thr protein kinase)